MTTAKQNDAAFSDLWDFSPARYNAGIAATNLVNQFMLAGAAVYAASLSGNLRVAFCAAVAGVLGIYIPSYARKKAKKNLFNPFTSDAPAPLKSIVTIFMRRAGIQEDIPVKIVNIKETKPDGAKSHVPKKWKIKMNNGLAVIPAAYNPYKKPAMMIGHEALKHHTPEQLASFISHEISHIVNPNSPKLNPVVNWGLRTHFLLAALAFVTIDPVLFLLGAGAIAAGKALQGIAGQFDEFRADFNSLGLYPHPTAFPEGLRMMKDRIRSLLYPDPKSLKYIAAMANFKLFNEHPNVERRVAAHRKHYPEVTAFYREHNLSLPV